MTALRAFSLALVLVVGSVIASLTTVSTPSQASSPTVLEFQTMTPVTGPYVGATNPIRNVPGGGLPWRLTTARGELASTGHLEIQVRGLVLAAGPLAGTNPIANFKAIVSCQSIDSTGAASIANVSTGLFPASSSGDSKIEADVTLPHPCIAPIVFVTSPGGNWFAATGN